MKIGDASIYVTTGEFDDGTLAEVFIKMGKQGGTLQGFAAWVGITISLALQYGITIDQLAAAPIRELCFEPNGHTDDPDLPRVDSIAEAILGRLMLDYGAP